MATEDFNFAYDFEGQDRTALLHEAVAQLNALEGGAKGGLESQEAGAGALAAALFQEQASLPVFPDVYHISDQDYLARDLAAPVKFTQLSKDFDFYWLRFRIGLLPSHNWTFNRLEVRVEFNPDGTAPHLRPRAYEILPNKKFQTLVEADQHLKLGFDENFELAAKTGVVGGQL
ncbi:MAG TPA: hypothetical protein VLS48_06090, partial [Anaerolineales bacterium]|nr:hypothetical protein [Anaerolineales bacterium]